MTYCVGMRLDRGLVFMSDTRTNAGVDNIFTFSKMRSWCKPGERMVTILSAGNLATTQSVISLIDERSKAPGDRTPTIMEAPSLFQVARIVGETLREVVQQQSGENQASGEAFGATLIVGGQVAPGEPGLFLVYPEGNFIEASGDTPYFQTGETKYGRPILVRAYDKTMPFEEAVKLLLVSFDSTIRANVSVDMPLDLQIYEADSYEIGFRQRIERDDPYFRSISDGWGDAIRSAFQSLPSFSYDK